MAYPVCLFVQPPPLPLLPVPATTPATAAASTAASTATTGAAADSSAATADIYIYSTTDADTADVKEDNTVVGSKYAASYLPHSVKLPQKLAMRGAPVPVTVRPGPHFDSAAVLRNTILNPSQVLLCAR
jgi:hypothetical protein